MESAPAGHGTLLLTNRLVVCVLGEIAIQFWCVISQPACHATTATPILMGLAKHIQQPAKLQSTACDSVDCFHCLFQRSKLKCGGLRNTPTLAWSVISSSALWPHDSSEGLQPEWNQGTLVISSLSR